MIFVIASDRIAAPQRGFSRSRRVAVLATLLGLVAMRGEVALVEQGRAVAVIVTADQPTAVARYAAARVEFLRLGLMHAELCARVAERLSLADPAVTPERGREALRELLAFRRTHERTWISNLNHCAWVEEQSWKLSPETKQSPDLYP